MENLRRAVGIIRVSETKGRSGESFTSPKTQRERIEAECQREGLQLIQCFEELDVSGGKSLDARPHLSEAVRMIEAGEAEVIVAAYFGRLVRSLQTQAELLARVEAAGGQVRAVDAGKVGSANSGEWLDSTMRGMMAEYQRRQGAERTSVAQADAIARGVPLWARVTAGYRRAANGSLEPDPATAPIVVRAFEMRAEGKTIEAVREYLVSKGIRLSQRGVQVLLASRVVLGELHFGKYEPNLQAWPAIVDRELWHRVQRTVISRGVHAKSERLLARLGILRCATCGGRMTASARSQEAQGDTPGYQFYRCGRARLDCSARASVGAKEVEPLITDAVRAALADVEGRASTESHVRDAEAAVEQAQVDLESAIRAFASVSDEPVAIERLAELQEARDATRAHLAQLGGASSAVVLTAAADWDRLTTDERRALIRVVVKRATVAPGRGPDRVTIEFVGE
jgi:site-specific DNA recombinase